MHEFRPQPMLRRLVAGCAAAAAMLAALPAHAQWIDCPAENPMLVRVPELISQGGRLRGTLVLGDEEQRLTFRQPPQSLPGQQGTTIQCAPQYVRTFRGVGAVPPPPQNTGPYPDPLPGPTLRARVGDIVQLTFLNQINAVNFGASIDRGETAQACDASTSGYPQAGGDTFPDCFHGSSTGNIHFHGTHTNPTSTGDNVFIEVRPSLRTDGRPVVTAESVKEPFDRFFAECEQRLAANMVSEWPTKWADLPANWTDEQTKLLQDYDKQPEIGRKLWPVNARQIAEDAWPQYYIGAYPYCFRLPDYTATTWPPGPPTHAAHGAAAQAGPTLRMGQAPCTHWYHAHKHGSTAINVANGMTGAFIIEGKYDDDLNAFYGAGWTRTQHVMVINQLGVTPNLLRRGPGQTDKGPNFSVNGRINPTVTMQPGEVQMWRILNTSGRAGAVFDRPPDGFQWKQIAQDGVQFNNTNYQANQNDSFTMSAGNRVDLLVKASDKAGTYPVLVQNAVDPSDLAQANKVPLVTVNVAGSAATPPQSQFIPTAPSFPPFLADITDNEVTGSKTIVFASTPPGATAYAQHTVDGRKFDGNIGAVVLLNAVEEWKIVNRTFGPPIAHPFHIHVNPFQVTEVFDPNEPLGVDP